MRGKEKESKIEDIQSIEEERQNNKSVSFPHIYHSRSDIGEKYTYFFFFHL